MFCAYWTLVLRLNVHQSQWLLYLSDSMAYSLNVGLSFYKYHKLIKTGQTFRIFTYSFLSRCKPSKHETPTQCWATVSDAGPTLVQHWVGVSCLLGRIIISGQWKCKGEICVKMAAHCFKPYSVGIDFRRHNLTSNRSPHWKSKRAGALG